MEQATCVACDNTFSVEDLVYSEAGKICQSCELDQAPESFGNNAVMTQIIAVLFAVAPFFVSYSTGVVSKMGTSLTLFSVGLQTNLLTQGQDHVPFFGGLLALAFGGAALKASWPNRDIKGICVAALAIISGLLNVVLRSGYLY